MMEKLPDIAEIGKIGAVHALPRISKEVDLPQAPYIDELTRTEELEKHAKQGVMGSLPERIIWKWLEDRGHLFDWQASMSGGRMMKGGFVIDFVVYTLGAVPVAIRVMGDYWHGPTAPGSPGRDDEDSARLKAKGYIVCDLWEEDVYRSAETGTIGLLIYREMAA